jgi:hypothetical protein
MTLKSYSLLTISFFDRKSESPYFAIVNQQLGVSPSHLAALCKNRGMKPCQFLLAILVNREVSLTLLLNQVFGGRSLKTAFFFDRSIRDLE